MDGHNCTHIYPSQVISSQQAEKTNFNKFKVKILFMVPRNDKIKPRNKFAVLLAVIQQQYTDTTLKQ
eukprot:2074455-Ditylum_brightwellii.AAC.1